MERVPVSVYGVAAFSPLLSRRALTNGDGRKALRPYGNYLANRA
ncbi:MAG TPA: hypothetical protein PLD47_00230 [Aggregatilineales bacterium]|nr:hypothetical protein [Aggregatilineales bacterium]